MTAPGKQQTTRTPDRWRSLWNALTAPDASLQNQDDRQQARLLATLTLVLVALGTLVALVLPLITAPRKTLGTPDIWIAGAGIAILVLAYRLSRTRRYRLAARLAVLVASGTIFALVMPLGAPPRADRLLYLVIPVLLSSILLPLRETVALIVAHLLGMVALPVLFASIAPRDLQTGHVLLISIMMLIGTQYLAARMRQRQHELQHYTARTRAMLAAFPDLIFRVDANGTILDYEAAEHIKPYRPPEEFLGRTLYDVLPPETAAISMARIRKTLDTRSVQTSEYSLINHDGEREWFEARSVPYGPGEVLTVVRDVTERHRAAHALRRSEESKQALVDAIPDLMFRLDRDGVFRDYKPARIGLNMPAEQFLGKPIRDVLPQLAEQTEQAIARALATEAVQVFEYQLPLDGKLHTYEARIGPGGNDEAIAIVRDVTEQRATQTKLHERETRYRTLFEESPIALWEEDFSAVRAYITELRAQGIADLATYLYQHPEAVRECARRVKVLDVNQATLDLFGLEIKDTLLDTLEPLIDDEWYRVFRREIVAFANGTRRYESETTHANAAGATIHALLVVVIPPTYQDTWERVYVSVTDITEHKRTEAALAASQRQLDLVLEGAELGLWDWDLTTNRLAFSHWWAGIVGYHVDELEPHISTWDGMLHPDDRARVWAAHHAHMDGHTPGYESEYRLRTKSGGWVWVLDRGKIVARDETGKPLRMVGTIVDITNRKHIEETARQQRALAEALGDVSKLLTGTLDVDEVLDQILITIGRVVPHDASSVALLDHGMVHIVRSQGYDRYGVKDRMHDTPLKADAFPTIRYMISTRQPVLVPDTANDPLWVDLNITTALRSYVGAPISWDEHVAGFIGLQSATPNFFDRAHAERLRAFADQAAIALRNAQWYNTAQRHLAEMRTLQQIMLDITRQLDPDALLKSLIQHALTLLDADAGGLLLYDPEVDALVWSASAGVDAIPVGTSIKRGEGLAGQVWERGEALAIDNYRAWEGRHPLLARQPYHAAIGAPINWQGQLLGVVNAAITSGTRTFTEHDTWLLNLFANQAAAAIQNARLFNAEFEQRALAEALRDTAAAINSTLDLHEILDRVLIAIGRVIPYDAANILLVDGDHVYVAHHRGYDRYGTEEYMRNLRVPIDAWPTLYDTLEAGQGFLIADTHTDPNWLHRDETAWVRAMIGVPIRSGDSVIGELNLDRAEPHSFKPDDLAHVQAFADQAGIAINNARLYAEVRRHRDELERRVLERTLDLSVRNAVAETLSSSIDTDEMLNGVLHVVTEQLDVQASAVYLLDQSRATMTRVASYVAPSHAPAIQLPDSLAPELGELNRALAQAVDVPSVLAVPIWRQAQVEGAIALLHGQPRTWDEGEHRMLDAIGRQLGIALANARSYASAVQGEARIRTILQSVTDGLLVFDKNDDLLLMNPAAEEMLQFYALADGGERRAATRLWAWLHDHTTTHPQQQRVEFMLPHAPLGLENERAVFAADCGVAQCGLLAQGDADALWPCWLHPGELPLEEAAQCKLYKRARLIAVQAERAPVSHEEGDVLGTVIVLNDVTHYRELDELKGRFVSTVSHELRTPLSTILLQIGTLLKYYDRFDEPERRAMIGDIQAQSQVLRDLVEDILELSRFDARRSLPQKQWFDIVATCQNVLESMTPAIKEKALTVDRAQCGGSRYVMGDPNQLQRAIRNLVSNAIKYTPPGGTITLALHQQDRNLVLTIADSGIGIAPEEQEHIFDRFYRTRQAVDMASGTGLGLPITREIVEMHGGSIAFESTPGAGSTFTITLPLGGLDAADRR